MFDDIAYAPEWVKTLLAPVTATCAILLLTIVLLISIASGEVKVGLALFDEGGD